MVPRDLTLVLGHLAEASVNLGELVGDLTEALGQAALQGCMQLFVDRLAHLVELLFVVLIDCI